MIIEMKTNATTNPVRVLVVDDDEQVLLYSARVLERLGFAVDVAADGEVGWQALNNRNYDLLITDFDMPNMTGKELIRRARSAKMLLPAILMSGTFDLNALSLEGLGVAALIEKPFSFTVLAKRLQEVLAKEPV